MESSLGWGRGHAAADAVRPFDREIPVSLRHDLEFILGGGAPAPELGRSPGLLRSVRAVASGKLALLAALGVGALALLGRPYGIVEDEPRPARSAAYGAPRAPALIRLGRGAAEAAPVAPPTSAPGVRQPPASSRAAPQPAPPVRAVARVAPAPAPAGSSAGDRGRARPEPFVATLAAQAIAPPAPRIDIAVAPITPRLKSPPPPNPSAGLTVRAPAPAPAPSPAAKKPAKPSTAARRRAVDDLLHLRYGW